MSVLGLIVFLAATLAIVWGAIHLADEWGRKHLPTNSESYWDDPMLRDIDKLRLLREQNDLMREYLERGKDKPFKMD